LFFLGVVLISFKFNLFTAHIYILGSCCTP
jgi:hypothetical protein